MDEDGSALSIQKECAEGKRERMENGEWKMVNGGGFSISDLRLEEGKVSAENVDGRGGEEKERVTSCKRTKN